ncbi:MAG: alanine racemase [Alphaproteobacteria bacterium]|nr:alanine racemase [Alphaproteobacteria bacterium]
MTGIDAIGRRGGATLEIDPGAVVDNWRLLCRRHPGGAVAAVVKADAYGLGARAVVPALVAAGCGHFFVASLDEALAVRDLAPGAVLAVFNGAAPGSEPEFAARGITPVLNSLAQIDAWAALARRTGRALPALLHVDTGMSRLGLDRGELGVLAGDPGRLAGIAVAYTMTHLVSAELSDDPLNRAQLREFALACAGLPHAPRSLANSSGIFLGPNFASDLARPGAALYGINPTPTQPNPMRLPVRLTAPVLQVREIPAGTTVGYNATWRAARPSRIGTVGIGYADGWLRSLSGRSTAHFDGRPLPLVGRVSMDLTTYDLTDHPEIGPGARLELIGPAMPPDAVAEAAGTNGYEILTSLGSRCARLVKTP